MVGHAQPPAYYIQHFNSDNGLPQNSIKEMKMDAKGYLWLATESGLVRFDGSTFRQYNQLNDRSVMSTRLVSLHLGENDTVFVRTTDKHFYRVDHFGRLQLFTPPTKYTVEIKERSGGIPFIIYEQCRRKIDNKEQPPWIMPGLRYVTASNGKSMALYTGHYYWFNEKNELIVADTAFLHFKKLKMVGFPLLDSASQAASILTNQDGLYIRWGKYMMETRLEPNGQYLQGDTILNIGDIPNISTFARYKTMNMMVVGTRTDGFYLFRQHQFSTALFNDRESNVFYAQAPFGKDQVLTEKGMLPGQHSKTLSGYYYISLLKTREEHYLLNKWINNVESGLTWLDSHLKEITYIPQPGLRVRAMIQLQDGSTWLSADHHFLGRLEKDSIHWLPPPPALSHLTILTMQEVQPGSLLIAGLEGLAKIHLSTGACEKIPGFDSLGIRSLYTDSKGINWLGTYGNGYYALYKGKSIKMPLDKDQYLSHTHAFLEDANGYCWMSTNQGLFQARLTDMHTYVLGKTPSLYYHYYDKNSGFLTNEFNGGCFPPAVVMQNGRFSFPSMNGLVQFDPLAIRPILSTSNIYIDQVIADTTLVNTTDKQLAFPHGTKKLQLTVSSPFFGTPYNHTIQYRMEGLDTAWQPLPTDGTMTFNRLPRGNYRLVIRKWSGFNNDQVSISLGIIIKPAFYETWFFKATVILLSFLLIWLLFRIRMGLLVRQKKQLEGEVKARTKEQQHLIERLETSVTELESTRDQLAQHSLFLEKLTMTITHDLQSPLRFFSDVSATINAKAREANNTPVEELSAELSRSSKGIHRFVQDFGWWIKSMGQNFLIRKEPVGFLPLMGELSDFFADLLKQRGNELIVRTEQQVTVMTDAQLLRIILRNIIDNANKYTKKGTIEIATSVSDKWATIIIRDNGRGIAPDRLAKIHQLIDQPFTSFYQVKESNGYGYYFIVDFCKLLDITISIQNNVGGGTLVTLSRLKACQPFH